MSVSSHGAAHRIIAAACVFGLSCTASIAVPAEPEPLPHAFFRTCGSCPSGYATTGIVKDAVTCPDYEHQLVQCAPIGMNQLMVCGECPEGYLSIGSAPASTRCGAPPGGKLSQCQLQKLEPGGVQCPPNCAADRPPPMTKGQPPGSGDKP
jgi:hypothetical protein